MAGVRIATAGAGQMIRAQLVAQYSQDTLPYHTEWDAHLSSAQDKS